MTRLKKDLLDPHLWIVVLSTSLLVFGKVTQDVWSMVVIAASGLRQVSSFLDGKTQEGPSA